MSLLNNDYKHLVDKDLIGYIDENVLSSYDDPVVDEGHKLPHIKYVVNRSMKFAVGYNNRSNSFKDHLNLNMVYAIACYHDIGLRFGSRKEHAENSAKYMLSDKGLDNFFTNNEIFVMSDAVAQHRASFKGDPSTIYGKVVSQADRDTDVDAIMYRTFMFRCDKEPYAANFDKLEWDVIKHLTEKYTSDGYASDKIWFPDAEFEAFIREIDYLMDHQDVFHQRFKELIKIRDIDHYQKYFPEVDNVDKVLRKADNIEIEAFSNVGNSYE